MGSLVLFLIILRLNFHDKVFFINSSLISRSRGISTLTFSQYFSMRIYKYTHIIMSNFILKRDSSIPMFLILPLVHK